MQNDITDGLADAIIGAILIGRLAGKAVIPGIQNGKDLTPKPGTQVFKPTPGFKPPAVQKDQRMQEARRSKQQDAWRRGTTNDRNGIGTDEDPGWTN